MKKEYTKLTVIVEKFSEEEVITTSVVGSYDPNGVLNDPNAVDWHW